MLSQRQFRTDGSQAVYSETIYNSAMSAPSTVKLPPLQESLSSDYWKNEFHTWNKDATGNQQGNKRKFDSYTDNDSYDDNYNDNCDNWLAVPDKNSGWQQKNAIWQQKNEGWQQKNAVSPKKNPGWQQKNAGPPKNNAGWQQKNEGWQQKNVGWQKPIQAWPMKPKNAAGGNTGSAVDMQRKILPLFCKLCCVKMNSNYQATTHYIGKTHMRKKEVYLQNTSKDKSGSKPNLSITDGEELTEDSLYCDVCQIKLNSSSQAEAHYSSVNHQRRAAGEPVPPKKVKPAVPMARPPMGPPARMMGRPPRPMGFGGRPMGFGPRPMGFGPRPMRFPGQPMRYPGPAAMFKKPQPKQIQAPLTCDVCKVTVMAAEQMQHHLAGAKHKTKLSTQGTFKCQDCELTLTSNDQLQCHLQGYRHKLKLGLVLPKERPAKKQKLDEEGNPINPPKPDEEAASDPNSTVKTGSDKIPGLGNPNESDQIPGLTLLTGSETMTNKSENPAGNTNQGGESKPDVTGSELTSDGTDAEKPRKPKEKKEPKPIVMLPCTVCNITVNSEGQLQLHLASKKHLAIAAGLKAGTKKKKAPPPPPFFCTDCQLQMNSDVQYQQHLGSKRHQESLGGMVPYVGFQPPRPFFPQPTGFNRPRAPFQPPGFNMPPRMPFRPGGFNQQPRPRPPPPRNAVPRMAMYRTPSGKFYCQKCDVTLNSEQQFTQHYNSKKHTMGPQAAGAGGNTSTSSYCFTCQVTFNSKLQYTQHMASKKHRETAMYEKMGGHPNM